MAERRMFAKTIVTSDAFLDMPLGARCLYMTLSMLADDDGFVNSPKSIMRQCGATEDDLKVLFAKKFVIPFDSGVVAIKHWRVNNYLQKDRYIPTKYIREKALLTIDGNGIYHLSGALPEQQSPCIQDKNIVYTQDSIGKDSIGKLSIEGNTSNKVYTSYEGYTDTEQGNFSEMKKSMFAIVEAWNKTGARRCNSFNSPSERWSNMCARLSEVGLDGVLEAIGKVKDSAFLHGKNNRGWVVSLDWFLKADNFQKVIEGQYDEEFTPQAPPGRESTVDRIAQLIREGELSG
jgi:hypothetical protein